MDRIGHLTSQFRTREKAFVRIPLIYKPKFAGVEWMKIANEILGDFEKTPQLMEAWRNLLSYAFANPHCVLKLDSAIGLIGRTGSGKTKTMHILNDFIEIDGICYWNNGIKKKLKSIIVNAKEISGEYMKDGFSAILKYSTIYNLCIDDIGSEMEDSGHYGNKINVIGAVIESRYDNSLFTHFTSNLDEAGIKERYGDRVYSRIKECCNIITINDKDFRIKS